MGRLEGKVALITGGARGQGAAEGKLFRAEGAEVYLTDVLVDEGQKTAAEIGATFIEHDVTDSGAWAEIVSRIDQAHGHLDVLINNAGIFHMVGLVETERELWDRTIAINQTGVFLGLQAVSDIMIRQRSGSIINISSIAGLRGSGGAFAYGASKWAVRGMTKAPRRNCLRTAFALIRFTRVSSKPLWLMNSVARESTKAFANVFPWVITLMH